MAHIATVGQSKFNRKVQFAQLHWGTDEEDTMQDLAMHSPHLLEYFQYLTGKVLEYETKLKGLRGELNAHRDTMERDAAYAEKLSAEVERY